jgi:glycosyltransferase involved in cell wall biosynthesis
METVEEPGLTKMAERPIKVLHVLRGMTYGGVETWLVHLLRNLDKAEVSFDFLVQSRESQPYDSEIEATGSRIIREFRPNKPWTLKTSLSRINKSWGPYTIIHSHVYLFSGLVLWAASKAGFPVRIFHIHPQEDMKRNSISRRLYRHAMKHLLARHSHGGLFLTESGLASFVRGFKTQGQLLETMHPVVSLDRFRRDISRIETRKSLNLPADATIVVYIARFVRHKNHRLVVEIARRLASRNDLTFVLAGARGEAFTAIEDIVEGSDNIMLMADIEDVSGLMKASDIFLFPSLNEGFGIVALEALASGLPVIATDLPAIREAIPPSMHRFMFRSDDLATATENLRILIDDEELRRDLSREGKRWSGRFSIWQTTREISHYYSKLVMKHCVRL